jgi:hypothetical protein
MVAIAGAPYFPAIHLDAAKGKYEAKIELAALVVTLSAYTLICIGLSSVFIAVM